MMQIEQEESRIVTPDPGACPRCRGAGRWTGTEHSGHVCAGCCGTGVRLPEGIPARSPAPGIVLLQGDAAEVIPLLSCRPDLCLFDPPWEYSNTGGVKRVEVEPGESRGYRGAYKQQHTHDSDVEVAQHLQLAYELAADDAFALIWWTFPRVSEAVGMLYGMESMGRAANTTKKGTMQVYGHLRAALEAFERGDDRGYLTALYQLTLAGWVRPSKVFGSRIPGHVPGFWELKTGGAWAKGPAKDADLWIDEAMEIMKGLRQIDGMALKRIRSKLRHAIKQMRPKGGRGVGTYVRGDAEPWILGRKGDAMPYLSNLSNLGRYRKRRHSEKPPGLIKGYVEGLTPPNGLALSVYTGYGSDLIAAHAAGRRCIGIELLEERCGEACETFAAYLADPAAALDLHRTARRAA